MVDLLQDNRFPKKLMLAMPDPPMGGNDDEEEEDDNTTEPASDNQ